MLKKYLCSLPDGRESQQAIVLGRNVTLTNNRIYNESVITKVYPSYFKLIKEEEEESRIIPEVRVEVPEETITEPATEEVTVEAADAGDTLIQKEEVLVETTNTTKPHSNSKRRRRD